MALLSGYRGTPGYIGQGRKARFATSCPVTVQAHRSVVFGTSEEAQSLGVYMKEAYPLVYRINCGSLGQSHSRAVVRGVLGEQDRWRLDDNSKQDTPIPKFNAKHAFLCPLPVESLITLSRTHSHHKHLLFRRLYLFPFHLLPETAAGQRDRNHSADTTPHSLISMSSRKFLTPPSLPPQVSNGPLLLLLLLRLCLSGRRSSLRFQHPSRHASNPLRFLQLDEARNALLLGQAVRLPIHGPLGYIVNGPLSPGRDLGGLVRLVQPDDMAQVTEGVDRVAEKVTAGREHVGEGRGALEVLGCGVDGYGEEGPLFVFQYKF